MSLPNPMQAPIEKKLQISLKRWFQKKLRTFKTETKPAAPAKKAVSPPKAKVQEKPEPAPETPKKPTAPVPPKTDEVISGEEEKKETKILISRRDHRVKDHLWVTGDLSRRDHR